MTYVLFALGCLASGYVGYLVKGLLVAQAKWAEEQEILFKKAAAIEKRRSTLRKKQGLDKMGPLSNLGMEGAAALAGGNVRGLNGRIGDAWSEQQIVQGGSTPWPFPKS